MFWLAGEVRERRDSLPEIVTRFRAAWCPIPPGVSSVLDIQRPLDARSADRAVQAMATYVGRYSATYTSSVKI